MAPLRESYGNLAVTVEIKKGGQVRDYTIGDVPEVPRELGLIVGDCLHNLRATLDNLAYSIAVDNNATLTSDERRACAFPLAERRRDFRASRKERGTIAKLPARAQATIQALQPFKAGHDAEREPLAILRQLSDLDKHRPVPSSAGPRPRSAT
jgi:hypothetical protein